MKNEIKELVAKYGDRLKQLQGRRESLLKRPDGHSAMAQAELLIVESKIDVYKRVLLDLSLIGIEAEELLEGLEIFGVEWIG